MKLYVELSIQELTDIFTVQGFDPVIEQIRVQDEETTFQVILWRGEIGVRFEMPLTINGPGGQYLFDLDKIREVFPSSHNLLSVMFEVFYGLFKEL